MNFAKNSNICTILACPSPQSCSTLKKKKITLVTAVPMKSSSHWRKLTGLELPKCSFPENCHSLTCLEAPWKCLYTALVFIGPDADLAH